MRRLSRGTSVLVATFAVLALALAAAATASTSRTGISGKISADGSSTVGPYVAAAAERFERRNPGAEITVGISGTGGGFERFCRGETDLSNASRPIKQSESAKCRENGVRYIAFLVANDGLSIVVNKGVTWISCITPAELKKIWDRGSTVDNWSQVRQGFPNVPLKLYGPGTDSGTFDFFTEKINGTAKRSRSDYTASEDDNVLVRGVEGDRGAMGYFGYSYYVGEQGPSQATEGPQRNSVRGAEHRDRPGRDATSHSRGPSSSMRSGRRSSGRLCGRSSST